MTKFQKFWVPEYLQCTKIKIQPKGKYCYFQFKVFFLQHNHTWQSSFSNQLRKKTSHIFIACFLMVKIMLMYAKLQQLTQMSRLLQNVTLEIFHACDLHP